MAKLPKFKVGDKIKPTNEAKSSNYLILKELKTLIIVDNGQYSNYSKRPIRAKIVEGKCTNNHNYSNYYKGDTITVYDDAFELLVPEEEDYEIY